MSDRHRPVGQVRDMHDMLVRVRLPHAPEVKFFLRDRQNGVGSLIRRSRLLVKPSPGVKRATVRPDDGNDHQYDLRGTFQVASTPPRMFISSDMAILCRKTGIFWRAGGLTPLL